MGDAETETETDADDVAAESSEDALKWFAGFRRFLTDNVPEIGTRYSVDQTEEAPVPPRVREARDLAVVAAYRAVARLAERFDPPPAALPPYAPDASRFGKDC